MIPTDSRKAVALVAAWALPAAMTLAFALKYAITIPMWDAWSWIDHLRDFVVHRLDMLAVLTSVHNEHPYGLPTLIFLSLGGLWDYSLKPFAIMSCIAMGGIALVLAHYSVRSVGRSVVMVLTISLLAMSLRQLENQVIGFQVGFPLTVLFGLGAVSAAAELRRGMPLYVSVGLIGGMTLCLVAAGFCSAASLAIFPAVGFVLVLGERSKVKWLALGAVALVCALWLRAYLPTLLGSNIALRSDFLEKAIGLLVLIGSPLTGNRVVGFALGSVILILFLSTSITFWRRSRPEQTLIAIGLMALGLVTTVAAGRGLMGGINPPRYATFGVPLIAVTIALVLSQIKVQYRTVAAYVALVVISAASIAGALSAYSLAKAERRQEIANTDIIRDFRNRRDPELAAITFARPGLLRELIAFLETNRFSMFSNPSEFRFPRLRIGEFQRAGDAHYEKNSAGKFVMRGPNHIYTTAECPESSCIVRWDLRGVTAAHGTIGLMFKDEEGSVLLNSLTPIEGISGGRAVTTLAAPTGTRLVEAYVYAPTENDIVHFRSAILGVRSVD